MRNGNLYTFLNRIIHAYQDIFREKMTLVDWHNHDNRLDDNNQILLKIDLSVSCKYM